MTNSSDKIKIHEAAKKVASQFLYHCSLLFPYTGSPVTDFIRPIRTRVLKRRTIDIRKPQTAFCYSLSAFPQEITYSTQKDIIDLLLFKAQFLLSIIHKEKQGFVPKIYFFKKIKKIVDI